MDITYEKEIKNEYRNFENWLDQLGNICYSILWTVGFWLAISIAIIGLICICFALTYDSGTMSLNDLQIWFRPIVYLVFCVTALFAIIFGLPKKLYNVFRNRALDRINSVRHAQNIFNDHVETTEALLLTYGLITEDDIEARKA